MPWSSGSFSRTNGTNTGSTTWQQDRDAGTKITASRHDTHDQDLADGINATILKDGTNAFTGDADLDGNSIKLDADADTKIGATSDDRIDITVGSNVVERIGHDATNSSAFHSVTPAAITAQAATNYAHVNVAPAAAVTVPAGTTAVVATMELNEPNITATGTVTAAATLYISGAPSEGGSNYALWVDAGNVQFDGDLTVSGTITGALQNVVDDTSPQLGGMLDVNGNSLGDGTLELLSFSETGSAVNEITIANAATGNGPEIQATGDDTNIDIELIPKGSGAVNLADAPLKRPNIIDYGETVNALGDLGGGTDDIDLESGNVVTATVSTSTQTFTFSNPPASGTCGSFTLVLTNGGSQTVNWPASVDWAGGTAPSLTSSGVDVLTFFTTDGGTTWYGFAAGLDMQ